MAASPALIEWVRRAYFERLAPGRECGDCVACCKFPAIDVPELRKPADVLCPHNTGRGCSIYEQRPQPCRTWHCLWRRIAAMPDEARPDRVGVVFEIVSDEKPSLPFERLYVLARGLEGPDAFDHPLVGAIIDMFARQGALPVFAAANDRKTLIYPDAQLADAILNPVSTIWQSRIVEAMGWRAFYGLDDAAQAPSRVA